MIELIEKVSEFASNTCRTAILSVTAALNGFLIDTCGYNLTNGSYEYIEVLLKHGSWIASIVLCLLGIITWIQKQKDRYYEKRKSSHKKTKE